MAVQKKYVFVLSLILVFSLVFPFSCDMDAMELSAHPHKMQMAANHAKSANATQCTCGHQAFKTIQKRDKIFSNSINWLSSVLPVISLHFKPPVNERSLFISGLLSPPNNLSPLLYLLNSVFLN
jgi:hypothetical protein